MYLSLIYIFHNTHLSVALPCMILWESKTDSVQNDVTVNQWEKLLFCKSEKFLLRH